MFYFEGDRCKITEKRGEWKKKIKTLPPIVHHPRFPTIPQSEIWANRYTAAGICPE